MTEMQTSFSGSAVVPWCHRPMAVVYFGRDPHHRTYVRMKGDSWENGPSERPSERPPVDFLVPSAWYSHESNKRSCHHQCSKLLSHDRTFNIQKRRAAADDDDDDVRLTCYCLTYGPARFLPPSTRYFNTTENNNERTRE